MLAAFMFINVTPVGTPPVYASDPKYKKYAQQVEKCLNTFDSVHEWADFISFLKQLLKVFALVYGHLWVIAVSRSSKTLEAYQQFKDIPRKVIVAKRLAQCLNPALPTGVHQRALDVYSHIFAVLGVCNIPYVLHSEIMTYHDVSRQKGLSETLLYGPQACSRFSSMLLHR